MSSPSQPNDSGGAGNLTPTNSHKCEKSPAFSPKSDGKRPLFVKEVCWWLCFDTACASAQLINNSFPAAQHRAAVFRHLSRSLAVFVCVCWRRMTHKYQSRRRTQKEIETHPLRVRSLQCANTNPTEYVLDYENINNHWEFSSASWRARRRPVHKFIYASDGLIWVKEDSCPRAPPCPFRFIAICSGVGGTWAASNLRIVAQNKPSGPNSAFTMNSQLVILYQIKGFNN